MTPTDTPVTTALPDPTASTAQATDVTTSAHEPSLTLWELMRKDVDPTPSDAASRVLSNPRPSIWDIE